MEQIGRPNAVELELYGIGNDRSDNGASYEAEYILNGITSIVLVGHIASHWKQIELELLQLAKLFPAVGDSPTTPYQALDQPTI